MRTRGGGSGGCDGGERRAERKRGGFFNRNHYHQKANPSQSMCFKRIGKLPVFNCGKNAFGMLREMRSHFSKSSRFSAIRTHLSLLYRFNSSSMTFTTLLLSAPSVPFFFLKILASSLKILSSFSLSSVRFQMHGSLPICTN